MGLVILGILAVAVVAAIAIGVVVARRGRTWPHPVGGSGQLGRNSGGYVAFSGFDGGGASDGGGGFGGDCGGGGGGCGSC